MLQPGQLFADDYIVDRPLKAGGMGSVFLVRQRSTGAYRALKLMHASFVSNAVLRSRFEQEACIGAGIPSEHVVQVQAAGVDAATGTPWLAMEFLEGRDLSDEVNTCGPLPVARMREVMFQLCHALGEAHQRSIVHRDLKPENIFVAKPRRAGVPFTVKVLDFGIAKVVEEARASGSATQSLGTPLWMAPEQMEISSRIGPATDVWALGLIAFWLLTGREYWKVARAPQASLQAILREVCLDPLDPASTRAGDRVTALPDGFDAWFAHCVAREPNERFANAKACWEALDNLLSEPPQPAAPIPQTSPLGSARSDRVHAATPVDSAQDAPKTSSNEPARRGLAWVLVALTLLAVLGTGAFFAKDWLGRIGTLVVTVVGPRGEAVDDVEVFVDGERVCQTSPCRVADLASGVHLVHAAARGYRATAPQAESVIAGGEVALNIKLTPSPTGIRVPALAPGLVLNLDGKEVGPLPQDLSTLSPGSHEVKLHGNALFAPYGQRVELKLGEVIELEPQLKPLRLELTLDGGQNADGAKIYVVRGKDRRVVNKPLPVRLTLDPDRNGEYSIEATKPGFRDFEQVIEFEANQATKTLVISMMKKPEAGKLARATPEPLAQKPPPPANATLRINSIPQSKVLLDGRPLGLTPKIGIKVSPGTHTVVFMHERYGRKATTVTVQAGKSATAAVRFP